MGNLFWCSAYWTLFYVKKGGNFMNKQEIHSKYKTGVLHNEK